MKNPWLTGKEWAGIRLEYADGKSRLERIKTMADGLRAAIAWPQTQRTVRHAAERRLRRLVREGKADRGAERDR